MCLFGMSVSEYVLLVQTLCLSVPVSVCVHVGHGNFVAVFQDWPSSGKPALTDYTTQENSAIVH